MINLLSPGIRTVEQDNTLTVPSFGTTRGGTVGNFVWGPINEAILLSSESDLVSNFGKPNNNTFTSFFTAANFLSYSGGCYVVRVAGDNAANASSSNVNEFEGNANLVNFELDFVPIGKTALTITLDGVVVADEDYEITGAESDTITFDTAPGAGVDIVVSEKQLIENDDAFETLTSLPSSVYAKFAGDAGNSLKVILATETTFTSLTSAEQALFSGAPESTEVHFAVIDESGDFTNVAGTLLERREFLSLLSGAKFENGETAFYRDWINKNSRYVKSTGNLADFTTGKKILTAGADGTTPTAGAYQSGFNQFLATDRIQLSIIMTGAVTAATASYVLTNIAAVRKDCVVCISPELDDVLYNTNSEVEDILEYRTTLGSSSYGIMDCNWKLQYDLYNDVNRWIPLNGDIGGLIARTARDAQPFFSPAGVNRGVIKNVIKLAWNPTQEQRDSLYSASVNPVVTEFGVGTYLFGDRTLLTRPSAFRQIGVRILFILVAARVSAAAKFVLFEPNNEFTRVSFKQIIEPFLRELQGLQGVSEFRVVCDTTNNTPQVINSDGFVADVAIKAVRSINFITLNLIATREGVSLQEIGA